MMKLLFLYFVLHLPSSTLSLSFANIFNDGMVLQAAPYSAQVWGSLDGFVSSDVEVRLECLSSVSTLHHAEKLNDEWSVLLDKIPEGSICTIEVYQSGQSSLFLHNVHFGDVWVCSGQGNMGMPMSSVFNAEDEIADVSTYDNIYLVRLPEDVSDTPLLDIKSGQQIWYNTSNINQVRSFSSVCLLYAKAMSEKLGNRVFGLIQSVWAGTVIEHWTTQEGLLDCQVENVPERNYSYQYNAMIHPLHKFTIKGVLWYQGEANTNWNQNMYGCTFPTLISEWRRLWSKRSPTDPLFPFGFVQLSAFRQNITSSSYPVIRWHQTADMGFVPNSLMPGVFMAVALDTYDAGSELVPRNKQLVASRLASAGLNVAYGLTEEAVNGPFPKSINFISAEVFKAAEIIYDQDFLYELKESNGFYVCCESTYDTCDQNNTWKPIDSQILYDFDLRLLVVPIDPCATGFAYLWSETPVLGTEALAIYSTMAPHLPAAPWKTPVIFDGK